MNNAIEQLRAEVEPLLTDSWRDLDMLPVLDKVELALPALLQDEAPWKSYLIDYSPPDLMRIFLPVNITENKNLFINGHYFFAPADSAAEIAQAGITNPYNLRAAPTIITPNPEDVNLYHPHSVAGAFKILRGQYRQAVGIAKKLGLDSRPAPSQTLLQSADGYNKYAFNSPFWWHMVIPEGTDAVTTLMVTYRPLDWKQEGPRPPQKPRPLNEREMRFMFDHLRQFYPAPENAPDLRL